MLSTFRLLLGNEKINWIDTVNIHITLAFLGDTEEERIEVAGSMLRNICSGFGEFDFNIAGTGIFRNFRDPRVIWAGIEESEKLMKLNKEIFNGLKYTGFIIEERPFEPHVTLGRVKFLKNHDVLKSAVLKYKDTFFQKVQVQEVILYESILKPTGPVYIQLGKYSLF
jgi:2'-5' RNA ligase